GVASGPEHFPWVGGRVDNRRGRTLEWGVIADVDRDRVTEHLLDLVARARRRLARAVRARHGERPRSLQDPERDRMGRHPDPDGLAAHAQLPRSASRGSPNDDRERARPEASDEAAGPVVELADLLGSGE